MAAATPDLRSIRMPLELGTAALLPYAFGIDLVAFGAVVSWYLYGQNAKLPTYGVAAAILGVVVLVIAVRRRASDIHLSEDGLEVHGGARDGLRVRWSELSEQPCEITEGRTTKLRLRIGDRSVDLATGSGADEREALATLAQTIRAMARPNDAPPKNALDVLRCPSCGASNKAEDAESVPCAYCDAVVPVASPLRARIRDAHEAITARSGKERLVAKLVRQPASETVNALLFASAPLAAAALVFVFVRAHARFVHGRFVDAHALMIALTLSLASLGIYLVLRRSFLRRKTLRLVTMNFGPRPPATPGGRPTCRHCNAPLESEQEATFFDCAYCGTEHLAGFGLVRTGGRELEDEATLAATLAFQESTLRIGNAMGVVGILLVVLAITLAPMSVGYVTVRVLDWRCKDPKGDGEACWQAGDVAALTNAELAADLYWHGCRRWNLIACKRLGASYITFWNEPAGAYDAYKRVCDRGDDEGCCSFGCLFLRGQGVDEDPTEARRLFRPSCGSSMPVWCDAHVPRSPPSETRGQ